MANPELSDQDVDLILGDTAAWLEQQAHPNAPGGEEPPPIQAGDGGDGGDKPKPQIIIGTDLAAMATELEDALLELGIVYVRAGGLAHIVHDSSVDWKYRPEGAPVICAMPRDRLRELAGIAADWMGVKVKKGKGGEDDQFELVPKMPPLQVVDVLRARGQWRFRPIEGVVDSPVLRPNGSIHDSPGYDPVTRLVYDPGPVAFPPIPAEPTHAQAAAALELLLEPFAEFPMVEPCDWAALAALILSLIGRSSIEGCVPLFSVQAPTPGSGKGLMVDCAAIIATGRKSPKIVPTEEEETRKRLLSLAIESPATVCIDNVRKPVGGPALESALTDGTINDRILGSTKQVTATLRAVWTLTGNNVAYKGDLGRRVVPIDLDPEMESPEDRTFTTDDLEGYVREHRGQLYAAGLTILRAHAVAGWPRHGGSRKGSFERWDDRIRSAIIWAGGGDPVEGVERIRAEGDIELERLRALLISWEAMYGQEQMTVGEVVGDVAPSDRDAARAAAADEQRVALKEALASYSDRLDIERLGYTMRRLKGRVAEGLRLERPGRSGGRARYRVVRV